VRQRLIPLGIATLVSLGAATASVIASTAAPAGSTGRADGETAPDCSRQPAVNQHVPGTLRAGGVAIRTGPDRGCGGRPPAGRRGDSVTVHCYDTGGDGAIWIYYTDHAAFPRAGWSRGAYLAWTTPLDHC